MNTQQDQRNVVGMTTPRARAAAVASVIHYLALCAVDRRNNSDTFVTAKWNHGSNLRARDEWRQNVHIARFHSMGRAISRSRQRDSHFVSRADKVADQKE